MRLRWMIDENIEGNMERRGEISETWSSIISGLLAENTCEVASPAVS